ncbi:MAG: hypothetical protein QMB08_04175 [Acidimicrobiales bacterium]
MLDEVALPLGVDSASTQFLGKATRTVSKPNGLRVVEPGHELEFLDPFPIGRLWGVGLATAQQLQNHGISHVSNIVAAGLDGFIGHAGLVTRDERRTHHAHAPGLEPHQ